MTGASLTLEDDDAAPSVTLALAATAIAEDGGTTTVSATLSHPSSAATTVTVTGVSDFYTVGSDATVVIAAGQTANAYGHGDGRGGGRRRGQRGQPERDGDGHGVQRPGRRRRDR